VVVNAMRGVQTVRERLVGNIVRRALEYWCNAEKDLGERVERAFAPESP
jgi:hypothetical protein